MKTLTIAIIFLMISFLYLICSVNNIQSVYSSSIDSKAGEGTEGIDITTIISTSIAAVAGLAAFIWGMYTYRKEQHIKRKDIVFPLIEEFDRSPELKYAKEILDDRIVFESCWKYPKDYYHKESLLLMLRSHSDKPITDPGEDAIRRSFDSLLDFFCKLEYLLRIKLIKPEELYYFKYHITKAADEPSVIKYMKKYEFPLHGELDSRLSVADGLLKK
jgi:hypothetical protein